jgi:hypothetical protein
MDSEKLVRLYISRGSHAKTLGEETHEGDQSDSELTKLFDKALCCAIGPCRDDPVVSPPDIEDTTKGLQKVEYEKRELSWKFGEPSKWQQKNCKADHVDVSRPLKQLPITVWEHLSIPTYVPLCNISSKRISTRMEAERTPIKINMMVTKRQLRTDAPAVNCKLNELRVGDI